MFFYLSELLVSGSTEAREYMIKKHFVECSKILNLLNLCCWNTLHRYFTFSFFIIKETILFLFFLLQWPVKSIQRDLEMIGLINICTILYCSWGLYVFVWVFPVTICHTYLIKHSYDQGRQKFVIFVICTFLLTSMFFKWGPTFFFWKKKYIYVCI